MLMTISHSNMQYITVKLNKVMDNAADKYGWDDGSVGLPVKYKILTQAIKFREFGIDRAIRFRIKRKRSDFLIDPERALRLARKYDAFFTSKTRDGLVLYVVIPESKCEKVGKIN